MTRYYNSTHLNKDKLEVLMHPEVLFTCHSRWKVSGQQFYIKDMGFFNHFSYLTGNHCHQDHADSCKHQPNDFKWHS